MRVDVDSFMAFVMGETHAGSYVRLANLTAHSGGRPFTVADKLSRIPCVF
jgi:hypothetical protein